MTVPIKEIVANSFYRIAILCAAGFIFNRLLSVLNLSEFLRLFYLPVSFRDAIKSPWSYVTALFIHFDFFHLIGNLLMLFLFYTLYETYLLTGFFFSHFLFGGAFSFFLTQILVLFFFPRASGYIIGSSVSVFFIGAFLTLRFPDYSLPLMLLPTMRIKIFFLLFFAATSLFVLPVNMVGFLGHVAGTTGGALYYAFFYFDFFKKKTFFPKYKNANIKTKENSSFFKNRNSSGPGTGNKSGEERLNELLDKIGRSGFESLTEEEKREMDMLSGKKKKP